MPRESKKKKRERAVEVCRRMGEHYPSAPPALDFRNPYECVISVSLSAQTTDANVNKVTPELFRRWPDPESLAQADVEEVGEVIKSVGFWRSKAKNCVNAARMIMSDFNGEVPSTMADLQKLPGVGRKTANIVMNTSFGQCEGIAVDTHVFRIAHKLNLSKAETPSKTEEDLLDLIPYEMWTDVNSQWIRFGRDTCIARRPKCGECFLSDLCVSAGK